MARSRKHRAGSHQASGGKDQKRLGRGRRRVRRGRRLLMGGAAAGAAVTYFFDPDQGRRRRASVRDQSVHLRRELAETGDVVARDSRNRGRGFIAEASRRLSDDQPTEGRTLHHVKTAISANCRHPGAIKVRLTDGHVTLTGPILAEDADRVRAAVARAPGVEAVDDQLDIHDEAGDIPALQGEGRLGGPRPELLQRHWAPAPRAFAGALGGGMAMYGLSRRGPVGLGLFAGGGLLLARAVTNLPLDQLTGIGADEGVVQLDKSIDVDAPVEDVWTLWEDYEAFPTFMSHVRDVQQDGDGWSHWEVDGPLGTRVGWDAEVVEARPPEVLAWRSRPGTVFQHEGKMELQPIGDRSRVHVRLSCNPAGGALGHSLACLLGADPKKQLDDDMLRMKTLLETGNRPRDAARP